VSLLDLSKGILQQTFTSYGSPNPQYASHPSAGLYECKVELPKNFSIVGGQPITIVAHGKTKKDSEKNAALLACFQLQPLGVLHFPPHSSFPEKLKELDVEDFKNWMQQDLSRMENIKPNDNEDKTNGNTTHPPKSGNNNTSNNYNNHIGTSNPQAKSSSNNSNNNNTKAEYWCVCKACKHTICEDTLLFLEERHIVLHAESLKNYVNLIENSDERTRNTKKYKATCNSCSHSVGSFIQESPTIPGALCLKAIDIEFVSVHNKETIMETRQWKGRRKGTNIVPIV